MSHCCDNPKQFMCYSCNSSLCEQCLPAHLDNDSTHDIARGGRPSPNSALKVINKKLKSNELRLIQTKKELDTAYELVQDQVRLYFDTLRSQAVKQHQDFHQAMQDLSSALSGGNDSALSEGRALKICTSKPYRDFLRTVSASEVRISKEVLDSMLPQVVSVKETPSLD
jgi:hypothetical protein